MTKRNFIIAGVGTILLVLALIYFIPGKDKPTADKAPVEASEKQPEDGILRLSPDQIKNAEIEISEVSLGGATEFIVPGTVKASSTGVARLDARADGVVRKITKTLGDYVKRGETVALIESVQAANLSSDISAANARLVQARAAYNREKRLFDANVTARQDLEAAQTNLSVAQADVTRAQRSAGAAGVAGGGSTVAITSPISGRVTAASAVLGSYVTAGTELYQVIDPSRIQIEAALPSADANLVARGDTATVELPGGETVEARVRSVTPSLNPESRTATAVLSLIQPVSGLQPDTFVQVRIRTVQSSDPNLVTVPEEAVQNIDGSPTVFLRVKGGFKPVTVKTGARSAGKITIAGGLSAGQQIVTKNAFLLKAELEKEEAEHGH